LFLASSVFVKKPERIMALSLIMVLCLLVSRLAEFRLRARLAETQQTIPDHVHKPTARPTMRWVFQCFEGIELLHVQTAATSLVLVLGLQPVHQLVLRLLGPLYESMDTSSSYIGRCELQHINRGNVSGSGRKSRPRPVAPLSPALGILERR
jgi:hypothetical protein